jgi:UDP-N-acetylglucosamine--dolichyl-phosphate N-acetylglucosaminephosphotransferase
MWDYLVIFAVSSLVTLVFTRYWASAMLRHGIVGVDVHKPGKPKIPEMCGAGIIVGVATSAIVATAIHQEFFREIASFLSVILLAALVGAYDDLRGLNPRLKPLLLAGCAIPLLVFRTYDPRPVVPVIGSAPVSLRLSLVYPVLVFFATTIPANAVNMMDVLNGSMSGTCSISLLSLCISSIILASDLGLLLSLCMLGALLAFFYYNRYPARVFAGDIGDLSIGAGIGATAVIGRLEVVTIVALMPQIMNAFYNLFSVGRIFAHEELKERPTRLLSDGRLAATDSRNAAVTLTRIILARGPLKEKEIVTVFLALSAFSAFLSVVTSMVLMR